VSAEALLSEVELPDGARLALYSGRLVHAGRARSETVALAHLASVRIAFEREPRKLAGAVAFGAAALVLALAGPPLAAWARGLAAASAAPGRNESLDALLASVFSALAAAAATMPAAAAVLLALGGALAALWWYGRTTLTLAFGAAERAFSARGRDAALAAFAEALAERLAELTRRG
jgi:hypothetical protein